MAVTVLVSASVSAAIIEMAVVVEVADSWLPKPITMEFNIDGQTSDGGALLLGLAEQKVGVIESLSARIHDPRQPGKVGHTIEELLAQRIFSIACGYPDANDAAWLRDDPVLKVVRQLLPNSTKRRAPPPRESGPRIDDRGRRDARAADPRRS